MKAFDFMPGMTTKLAEHQDEYFTLPVIRAVYADGTQTFISAWRGSFIDRLRFLFGKPVYLGVYTMAQSPPVLLSTSAKKMGLEDLEKEKK